MSLLKRVTINGTTYRPAPRLRKADSDAARSGSIYLSVVGLAIIIFALLIVAGPVHSDQRRPHPESTRRIAALLQRTPAADSESWQSYLPLIVGPDGKNSNTSPTATPTPGRPPDPPAPYCIQGVVFHDVNADGVQNDPTVEPALAGFEVAIFMDRNNNAELDAGDLPPLETIITQGTVYRSGELEAGTYFANAEAPATPATDPSWVRTLPEGPITLTLSGPGGDFCEEAHFGFRNP
ncbi:MAG: hypothetical protein MAG451_01041 [Anaerolineales bacterium]|nr:hypothetical protein [Anaerolineales bacterium]